MSEESALRLRDIDVPAEPGARIRVWYPAGAEPFGPEPLTAGQGFTVDIRGFSEEQGGGRWRTVLRSWEVTPDGTTLEVEVERRY